MGDYSDYIHTVGDLRKALAEHPDDLPIEWCVDTQDYSARSAEELPILVTASIFERSEEEMECAPEHIKQKMLFISIGWEMGDYFILHGHTNQCKDCGNHYTDSDGGCDCWADKEDFYVADDKDERSGF